MSIGYSDLFCLSKEDLAEVLVEFPSARAMMEAKGRELLLRMGKLDVHAEAVAAAAAEEAKQRVQALETALEGLQTQAARLLAQLESSAFKLALRIERLECRPRRRQPAGGAGPARAEGPTMAQNPNGAQGPTRVRGRSRVQGPTMPGGPARGPDPAGGWGPTVAHGGSGVQGPPRVQGPPTARGPPRVRGARATGPQP